MTDLFSNLEDDKKTSIGKKKVEYKTASSIYSNKCIGQGKQKGFYIQFGEAF